ncbi:MAG: PAS domain S-box protein [Planctomycetes bacterium]|nr:PAS domain S-box protein [Planctomycetota bacterium]
MLPSRSLDARDTRPGTAAATRWLDIERRIVERIARSAEPGAILDDIARSIESALPGCRASIMCTDPARTRLRLTSAPSLPATYASVVEIVPVGPEFGACGAAAHFRHRVVAEDIASDPNWRTVRDAALSHGLRACWSQPILASDGTALGAFALYRSEPGRPGDDEVEGIEFAARLAGIAIERDEALRALKLRDAVFNEISDAIIVVDAELRIVDCNASVESIFGWKREQLLGKTPPDVFSIEEDGQPRSSEIVEHLRNGHRWRGDRLFRAKDGRVGIRESTAIRIDDPSGKPTAYVSINRDVTDQRSVEREARLHALQLQYHIDNSLIAFILWDADGRVRRWSQHAERVFGWTAEEALGKNATELAMIHPTDVVRVRAAAAELAAGSRRVVLTNRNVTKQGTTIECVWHNSALNDETGKIVSTMSLVLDVTEQHRAELEREELRGKMLQTLKLESLGILAGGVAHDFNNLLTGILGHAELLLETESLSPGARSSLGSIQLAATRAADLTRQMLAYAGRAALDRTLLDISSEVRDVEVLIASSIAKRIDLRFTLADDLPPIEADRAQLQQLAMNLVINAAEAIGDGDGEVVVSTWAWTNPTLETGVEFPHDGLPAGRYVVLEVRDDGCGMDEATIKRIFDPFFTTKFTGRGLGLAAALGIVRAHRGGVRVLSQIGRGSSFRVFFPVATREREAPPTVPPPSTESGATVLVVDDEPVVLELATAVLVRRGHHVLAASSGERGLALFDEHADEIDVVLLDVTMPRVGAREMVDALRKRRPTAKIVLSSGYAEAEVARQFARGEYDGFLSKPYSPAGLIAGLDAILAAR